MKEGKQVRTGGEIRRKNEGKTHLNLGVLGKVSPGLPVILVEGVFDRNNVVLLDEVVVDTSELLSGEPL